MRETYELLLKEAVDKLNENTDFGLAVTELEPRAAGLRLDARIALPGKNLEFLVEVKRGLRRAQAGAIIQQLLNYRERAGAPVMLVTDYLNTNLAEEFKAAGVPYLDAAGNAYIKQPPIYIYIAGQKQANDTEAGPGNARGILRKTGLKIAFALLTEPDLVEGTYREIADKAQVALGAVGQVLDGLKEQGFLVEGIGARGRKRCLENKTKLLEIWAENYPIRLKRQLKLGEFTTEAADWWERVYIEDFDAVWGGELAAAEYTNYLKPAEFEVYIDKGDMNRFLQATRLRKAVPGRMDGLKITLYEKFWKDIHKEQRRDLAPPELVYADLLETGDPRNRETAQRLWERIIDRA